MGERTSYSPGTFCWADLSTTDATGATRFYATLLGWEGEDMPVDDGVYTMMRLGGRAVTGIYNMPDDQRAAGAPAAWLSHVSVEDADRATARAEELGGTVVASPFDIMEAGRLAIIQDPQGAVLALWRPGAHVGARLVNDPGALCLNQLNTSDPEDAARFYTSLFGWRITQVASEPQPYWGIENAGSLNGGMMALGPGMPAAPHWLVYFTTADLDASAEVITREGGSVTVPPMAIGAGRILVARDPQGGVFALFEGRTDP